MKQFNVSGVVLDVVLCVTAVVMCILLALTHVFLENQANRYEEPHNTVVSFLSEYIKESSYVGQEQVVEKYFSCVNSSSIDEEGRSQVLRDLNSIVLKDMTGAVDFRVCLAKKDYVEIMMLDESGADLPCRIGMFYAVDSTNRISSFSAFRLQPVSVMDAEWNEVWQ